MKVLGLDPGGSTGGCEMEEVKLTWHGIVPQAELRERVRSADLVVAEEFMLYPHMADNLKWNRALSARVLGMIELICAEENIPLVFQRAVERSFFGGERGKKVSDPGNVRLREMGFWLPTPHERDACRHVLTYYRKQDHPALLDALRKMRKTT